MNNSSLQSKNQYLSIFSNNWGLFIALGIVLIILGILAVSVSALTTLASVVFLGVLLVISGAIGIADSFKYWWHKWSGFFIHLAIGILYLAAGLMLMRNPLSAAVSLTFILAIFYILLGLFRMVGSIASQMPRWGWSLFNGIVTLLLGLLILAHWPASSLIIIGLFVGIDLFVSGVTYIMLALSARAFTTS